MLRRIVWFPTRFHLVITDGYPYSDKRRRKRTMARPGSKLPVVPSHEFKPGLFQSSFFLPQVRQTEGAFGREQQTRWF